MALKNSQYYAIMREYEQRQLRNHDIQTARYEEVYKKLPEFKSLDESISILSVQYGKKLLNGDSHALDALKEELEILRSSKKNLLVSAGFPEDYLEPVYDCLQGHRIYRQPEMPLLQKSCHQAFVRAVQYTGISF